MGHLGAGVWGDEGVGRLLKRRVGSDTCYHHQINLPTASMLLVSPSSLPSFAPSLPLLLPYLLWEDLPVSWGWCCLLQYHVQNARWRNTVCTVGSHMTTDLWPTVINGCVQTGLGCLTTSYSYIRLPGSKPLWAQWDFWVNMHRIELLVLYS